MMGDRGKGSKEIMMMTTVTMVSGKVQGATVP